MTCASIVRLPSLALLAVLLACNGNDTGDGTESATSGETSTASTTSATTSTTAGSMSGTQTTTTSGASDSATTTTTTTTQGTDTEATGVSVSTSESSTEPTTDPTDATSTTDPTSTTDTTDATSTTDTTDGTTDGTTTDTTDGTTTEDTTTDGCVPAVEICNDLDDDCNGYIDDVDEAKDGICDCLNIVIMGNKGANPSSEFEAWLEAQGTKVDRIHKTPNEVLDANTLAPYDIVLLDWLPRTYTPAEASVLEQFIVGGGGMISLTGYQANQTNADVTNSLIKAIGVTYNTSKGWFSGPVTMFVAHPITMGLTSITFLGGLYITAVDDGVGTNQTIMTLPQGPVGVVQQRKGGRAFVFGDEWVEFDSQWQNLPEIKQFWVQTLKWVGPQTSCTLPQ